MHQTCIGFHVSPQTQNPFVGDDTLDVPPYRIGTVSVKGASRAPPPTFFNLDVRKKDRCTKRASVFSVRGNDPNFNCHTDRNEARYERNGVERIPYGVASSP